MSKLAVLGVQVLLLLPGLCGGVREWYNFELSTVCLPKLQANMSARALTCVHHTNVLVHLGYFYCFLVFHLNTIKQETNVHACTFM